MDFACSRCAHRQAEDSSCGGCGNDVVQDMRDARGRQVLRDAEARLHRKRVGRYFGVGAVVGLAIAPAFIYLFYRIVGPHPAEPLLLAPFWVRWKVKIIGGALFMTWAACCFGVIALLERTLGRRRRFPYLDEYEKAS